MIIVHLVRVTDGTICRYCTADPLRGFSCMYVLAASPVGRFVRRRTYPSLSPSSPPGPREVAPEPIKFSGIRIRTQWSSDVGPGGRATYFVASRILVLLYISHALYYY